MLSFCAVFFYLDGFTANLEQRIALLHSPNKLVEFDVEKYLSGEYAMGDLRETQTETEIGVS